MLKNYLMENYGYNEPIFLNELSIKGISQNAIRQSMKRLAENGVLERYDNGIYYIPKNGGVLGKSYLDPSMVVMRIGYGTSAKENTLAVMSLCGLEPWSNYVLIAGAGIIIIRGGVRMRERNDK